jgi:hypothetical protein
MESCGDIVLRHLSTRVDTRNQGSPESWTITSGCLMGASFAAPDGRYAELPSDMQPGIHGNYVRYQVPCAVLAYRARECGGNLFIFFAYKPLLDCWRRYRTICTASRSCVASRSRSVCSRSCVPDQRRTSTCQSSRSSAKASHGSDSSFHYDHGLHWFYKVFESGTQPMSSSSSCS